MNWTTYWATKQAHQPKIAMNNHQEYTQYLQDKNLSPNTIRLYQQTLQQFPQQLNTANVKEYFLKNQKAYEPKTLKTKQYALNSYLKFKQLQIEWEKIARLIPSVQKKFFDTINETELALIKQARVEKNKQIHQRNNLILDFLFYSGLRINELTNIQHHHWQGNQLKVHGKGNKVRYVLLPEFLITKFNPTKQDYLFTNQRGNPMKAEYIRWLLKERTTQANIPKRITPHTFRRSFATLLYQKGAQLMTIQKLLGHSSVQTTETYIHNDFAYLYSDYSKLWKGGAHA
ncbi:tyrosine-type recombinase/integrase [endosymbiont GvMRE of Glomus versiforme]|uniref:tyrosine-type recombinase/integrase n=1 Tax=endosymbiont GvMRE of Glomus versiforme TaxID=2039283 RepID=UPI000EC110C0|nr:tyrosine-type recombinase/integrase [endosymbiont GvMRE of Glomus versiforme]RHZ37259.1 Tyrosine recombinase XerC [endosymbiont GvMRE of Glomus versiforme]RHZ37351.1 Tyrosine recombinase XerC [endosymbiont GvMRE of Glomus versiforme]